MPEQSDRMVKLKQWLRAEALSLGFDSFGVTHPDPPAHLDVFYEWLQYGRHGEMDYLASERGQMARSDPKLLLPECRSIVVLAMNYLPQNPGPAMGGEARVSTYALGDDYHDLIENRLIELVRALEARVGGPVAHKIYTDTGPLLERELGQRAGLGWIGKNTCLIDPSHGSYFFLAELLLEIPLPLDDPLETDHCGSCRRCLDACPTGCILPDRTLDARRCISYLTIELRGPIPEELRDEIGEWVFGCDICQQVCPWNIRFARPTKETGFQTRPWFQGLDPTSLLDLDQARYRDTLHGSPLKRAKRQGLLRNAAVAAGNSGKGKYVEALAHSLLDEPQPLVRAHAAWALGQLGGRRASKALSEALKEEREATVIDEIRQAISELDLAC